MMIKSLLLICALSAAYLAHAQPVTLLPHLYHTPIMLAPAQQELPVILQSEVGLNSISTAQLLWRSPGGEFRSADFVPSGDQLTCSVPAADVAPPYVEYAILIQLSDGQTASFPLVNPLSAPQIIAVSEAPTTPKGPRFIVISPDVGELVQEPEVNIIVSILDPDSSFDPGTLQVFIDGAPSHISALSASFIHVKRTGLKAGLHEVTLRSQDFSGSFNPDYRWSFRTARKAAASPEASFSWRFTGEASLEEYGSEDLEIYRGDFRSYGKYGKLSYATRIYMTSEESEQLQPQNRFLFTLQGRDFSLDLGDAEPIFSDLVLSGKRVRGVKLGGQLKNAHLIGVFGELNRPLESLSYRRLLWGLRPYYQTAYGLRLGFSFLKVKDDLASVDSAAISPQDNVVAGMDFSLPLWNRKLDFGFQAALSLTAQDIRGGSISRQGLEDAGISIPFDPQAFESFLIINESLTPPNPAQFSSLAWMTSLTAQHFGQYLAFRFRRVGPAYYSLANPYLQNDLSLWSLSDQFSIWKRRLSCNVGINQQRDNLTGAKTTTTSTTGGWVTLAAYLAAPAPQLTVSVYYAQSGNQQVGVDTTLTQSDTLYVDQRRDENSLMISSALTQGIRFWDRQHYLTLSFNRSRFEDLIGDRSLSFTPLNNLSNNFWIIWRSELSRRHSLICDYSHSTSESAALNLQYQQFGIATAHRFWNDKVQINLAGQRRSGEASISRWLTNLRAEWEFVSKHSFRLDLSRYIYDQNADEGVYRWYYLKRF